MRHRGGLSQAEALQWQAWLQADARHAAAWEDMQHTFDTLRRLPQSQASEMSPPARRAPSSQCGVTLHRRGSWWASARGRWRAGGARAIATACVALLLGYAWIGWHSLYQAPVFERSFATARGQLIAVSLPDARDGSSAFGSELSLDAATRLQVQLYRDRREVRLIEGQALFSVAPDEQRPFHVLAGGLRITVVGTRFSVRHIPAGPGGAPTEIAVQEGRVRVAAIDRAQQVLSAGSHGNDGAAPPPELELTAGQHVTADAAGRLGAVTTVADHQIAPWRDGRIYFDQTPLAQAIAEFERYGRTGLVVHDPGVAALPVGGSYQLSQWQHFVQTLPQVLPVRLVHRGEVTEVVARQGRAGR